MKRKNIFLEIILFTIFFFIQTTAQVNINSISVNAGVIRNFTTEDLETNEVTFYPEIALGGKLFFRLLNWQISYGYWDDGIEKELKDFRFHSTFHFISNVVASRILFDLSIINENVFIPVRIITGVSYHLLNAQLKFPRGAPYEFVIEKIDKKIYYADIGLELFVNIYENFFINLKYIYFVPLNEKRFYEDIKRSILTCGIEYKF